ncbi:uncharacterized protein [Misgurnus anguillicaudatus]|uniref:uncharacterized protein isoform X1 n=1 Tax=Misgurnus anguillicaudatus TaxID=75329 RepID=UPI003CCFAA84
MYSGLSLDTEGGTQSRDDDGLEVSFWSDWFPGLTINHSRDLSHFADGKFTEASILRAMDDSPEVRLPLTNTEGGISKSKGDHGQEVRSDSFPDVSNIQAWDLLLSIDQMFMKPFIIHAEDSSPKACLSPISTMGDIFERKGGRGLEVGVCGDRFLDLNIHQSQDSSLCAGGKFRNGYIAQTVDDSPKVSLTDTEVDTYERSEVSGLEVGISSDSFTELNNIPSEDLSLSPVKMPMDLSNTVDDSPREQNGNGRTMAGIRGFFKRTCKAVTSLFLPSRTTKVEPIATSIMPDTPPSSVGLPVPIVLSLEQSSGSHWLEHACPVEDENAAKVCSMPQQTLNTDSDFGEAHVMDTSDIMSASSLHIAGEDGNQRHGAEALTGLSASSEFSLPPDIRSVEVNDISSEAIEMEKRHQLSDSRRVTGNSSASVRLDILNDMKKPNGTFSGVNPDEQPVKSKKKKKEAGKIRRFCTNTWKAVKKPFTRQSNRAKPIVLPHRSPSYEKLLEPTDGDVQSYYRLNNILGKGGFGMVREGTRISDGQEVAIKFMSKLEDDRTILIPGHPKPLITEVALMLKMSEAPLSPNVIRMFEWFEDPKDVIVIMEYPKPCLSLWSCLSEPLSENTARVLMRQAVQGVIDCIDHGVFHTDIHPGNILVNTSTLELKLIDFGCGQLLTTAGYDISQYRGIADYCPPEVFKKRRYQAIPVNVWGLGLVLFKMVNGRTSMPFENSKKVQFVNPDLSEECRSIICKCLALKPAKRPKLKQILKHRWFIQE